jgi:hypothetical protein
LTFSDEALPDDTLTTVTLNYQWRSLIAAALEHYYRWPDGSELSLDNQDKLAQFYEDLYN